MSTLDPEVRRERLRQLRRVVRAAPADQFLMCSILTSRAANLHACPRCAYGHARLDPWFRANTPIDYEPDVFAGGRFLFGLSYEEAGHLFGCGLCSVDPRQPTRAEVVWNIDQLILGMPTRPYDRGVPGQGETVPHDPDPEPAPIVA